MHDARIWERTAALEAAVQTYKASPCYGSSPVRWVLNTANAYFDFIVGPTRLRVTFGPVLDKETGEVVATELKGSPMQLLNTQKVTGRVDVIDRGGEDLPDNPDVSTDDVGLSVDNESVVTVESADGGREFTLTTVATGTAIFTVTLGDKVFTEAIDVLHSEADRLEVQFDSPTDK